MFLIIKSMVEKILFTCTSFISLNGKYDDLYKAITTFCNNNDLKNNQNIIIDYIIINEYSDINIDNLISKLNNKFPFINIINKEMSNKGQAKSLNIIINILKSSSYKYWIQWEESWFVNKPFLKKAYSILNNDNIDQLQFTKDAQRNLNNKFKLYKKEYFIVKKNIKYEDNITEWKKKKIWCNWPMFSLRPSINKVSSILKNDYFDTLEEKWPGYFEYEYALKWVKLGFTKAFLYPYKNDNGQKKFYVSRKPNHKHTYDLLNN